MKRSDRLYQLLQDLKTKAPFGHSVERLEILETHISYVLLMGPYAYKLATREFPLKIRP
jgi:aminoglycoside phosphotransferase family enzyme